jgi:hypothetical protein
MCIEFAVEQQALAFQLCGDILSDRAGAPARHPAIARDIHASVVEGCQHHQTIGLAKREIFLAGTWGDMYHPRALALADLVPRHHAMLDTGLRVKLVKWASISPADEIGSGALLHNLPVLRAED